MINYMLYISMKDINNNFNLFLKSEYIQNKW